MGVNLLKARGIEPEVIRGIRQVVRWKGEIARQGCVVA